MKTQKSSHQSELARQLAQTVELLESLQGAERATFIAKHRHHLAKLQLVVTGALALDTDRQAASQNSDDAMDGHSGQKT